MSADPNWLHAVSTRHSHVVHARDICLHDLAFASGLLNRLFSCLRSVGAAHIIHNHLGALRIQAAWQFPVRYPIRHRLQSPLFPENAAWFSSPKRWQCSCCSFSLMRNEPEIMYKLKFVEAGAGGSLPAQTAKLRPSGTVLPDHWDRRNPNSSTASTRALTPT